MSKIILLNHSLLTEHPEIMELLLSYGSYDWKKFFNTQKLFIHEARYSRTHYNPWPFRNEVADLFKQRMPSFSDKEYEFGEVTDHRISEILDIAEGRPWAICWSGGIDSTVMICSVLKNLEPQQRKNFAVYCNHVSIWENPRFFREFVEPNFKLIDSFRYEKVYENFDQYLWIDGEPADCLWGSAYRYRISPQELGRSWRSSLDTLVSSFIQRLTDTQSAKWFCERVIEDIENSGLEIDTLSQFTWWNNFNTGWIGTNFRKTYFQNKISVYHIMENFINWYDNEAYQQWSMWYNLVLPFESDYKKAAKQYIFDIDKNVYSLNFKTKMHSGGRKGRHEWLAVLDDGTYIAKDDINTVISMLPDHLNL